jgi:4-hydroxy-tetrahydrodipicolinate reductase
MVVNLAIAGATGRMGRRIIALAQEDPELRVVAALERAGHSAIGSDAGELAGVSKLGFAVTAEPAGAFDVLIDFTTPEGTMENLKLCSRERRPMVIGTTGHTEAQLAEIRAASQTFAVLKAANMSVGVNVMLRVTQLLAERLDETFDVEIVEAHHRFKEDAPSGTALALLEAVQRGRRSGVSCRGAKNAETTADASGDVVHGRRGRTGRRPAGEIGMHSLRIGDTVGEHTVSFGSLGETISVSHSAHSRDTFAAGAILAAKWIVGRPAGSYDMQQVLFTS